MPRGIGLASQQGERIPLHFLPSKTLIQISRISIVGNRNPKGIRLMQTMPKGLPPNTFYARTINFEPHVATGEILAKYTP